MKRKKEEEKEEEVKSTAPPQKKLSLSLKEKENKITSTQAKTVPVKKDYIVKSLYKLKSELESSIIPEEREISEDLKALRNVNSSAFDSSDDEQLYKEYDFSTKNDYIEKLKIPSSFPVTFFLTEISNRLLLSKSITQEYKAIKDPLKFKVSKLNKKLMLYNNAKIGVEQQSLLQTNSNNNLDEVKHKYEEKIAKLSAQISKIQDLQTERKNLKLKELFKYTPKNITPVFIKKYNEVMNKGNPVLDAKSIIQQLSDYRDFSNKVDDKKNQLLEVLGVTANENKSSNTYTVLTVNTAKEKILNRIAMKIPRTKNFLDNYLEKNSPDIYNQIKQIENVSNKLSQEFNRIRSTEYIFKKEDQQILKDEERKIIIQEYNKEIKNLRDQVKTLTSTIYQEIKDNISSDKVVRLSDELATYANDQDYLKELTKMSYLAQVRIYKKLNRDLGKSLILSGIDESETQVTPPGNTTLDVTLKGAFSLYSVNHTSYENLGKKDPITLSNYKNYFISKSGISPLNKENEFKSWSLLEGVRASSSLLTSAMFFELALNGYQSIANEKYDIASIADQMPVAMIGTVAGEVHIEKTCKNNFTAYLPYDYRAEGNTNDANELEERNCNILFNWIDSKINLKDVENKIINAASIKENDLININGKNWKCIKKSAATGANFTIESEDQTYSLFFCRSTPKEKYKFTAIKSFPLNILNEVYKSWYGIELSYLKNKTIKLSINIKAEAEVKSSDTDRDEEQGKVYAEDNMLKQEENKNPILRQDDIDYTVQTCKNIQLPNYLLINNDHVIDNIHPVGEIFTKLHYGY